MSLFDFVVLRPRILGPPNIPFYFSQENVLIRLQPQNYRSSPTPQSCIKVLQMETTGLP